MPDVPLSAVQRPAGSGPEDHAVAIHEDHPPADPVVPTNDEVPSAMGVTLANMFRHPLAHPLALDMLLLRRYGPEWFGWEPETIQLRIPQDFKGGLSSLNQGKIHAIATLHLVDNYWRRWEVFGWCTMAFNNLFADFETMQKPTAVECLISVDVASHVRTDVKWDPEVVAFMHTVFRIDGFLCPISPCDFVSLDLEDLAPELQAVRQAWPRVRDTQRLPSEESVVTEQLRRMLLAYDALEENRTRMRQQLALVEHA